MQNEMKNWEKLFLEKIRLVATADDPAHDLLHFQRVVALAKKLGLKRSEIMKKYLADLKQEIC